MNTLSYLSLMSQSLVRYDMANEMLNWAAAMSETKLKKMNFRQMKKFLQNKGWEYERPYPFKGRLCCTVSLLDIVRGEESKKFMDRHSDIMSTLNKTNASLRGSRVMDEDVCHMYLTPIMPLDIPNHNGRIYPVPKDILPEVITPLSYYSNCTKLEQETELPVHKVSVIGKGQSPQFLRSIMGPNGPTIVDQDNKSLVIGRDDLYPSNPFETSIGDGPKLDLGAFAEVAEQETLDKFDEMVLNEHLRSTIMTEDGLLLDGVKWTPPSKESVQEVNQMVSDIIEGKIEGNPLDLYGIVTRPYQAQLVSDMRRQTSIENPINDKILMSNSLKTTLGVVAEHKDKDIDILFSLKSLAARHPDLDPMDLKLSCGEIEGLTDEVKAKMLGLAAKYFAENFNLADALKGVELMPGYSLSVIPKDETND